ncbi:hypothetical protein IMSAG013_00965 [Clostridiales bacterium]|nr:hypothetical protein IMSAG013_00965 [Clostridiales bacterium]
MYTIGQPSFQFFHFKFKRIIVFPTRIVSMRGFLQVFIVRVNNTARLDHIFKLIPDLPVPFLRKSYKIRVRTNTAIPPGCYTVRIALPNIIGTCRSVPSVSRPVHIPYGTHFEGFIDIFIKVCTFPTCFIVVIQFCNHEVIQQRIHIKQFRIMNLFTVQRCIMGWRKHS